MSDADVERDAWRPRSVLLVDDLADREVRLHFRHFDFDALADLGVRHDDDVSALDARDPVALLADVLDLDVADLTLLDRRLGFRRRPSRRRG
ncbi:hypothetical protein VNG_0287H [Halobacterium salinarum NRC-1]|uniref:Spurious ORF n=1 Tax=Halobacterium salinarum (strain ATCC 700922 / JCM 11081 / NRC-1) TaxID=64091 RepID=Q9HSD3_HALSA|nr:hypothetical protein VNG_0287H [Halobacterium salinarum NRC-1]DAC77565.1 TPA_inf: spurious ORF [Halobacterium salinarum NRC-1]